MKRLFTTFFIISFLFVRAQIPAGYYDAAQGLTGYQLKTALHNIIDNHTVHTYGDLYIIYEYSDTDYYYENDGTVLDMYSENPSGNDPYNYTHHNNTCGTYSSEGDCYNREHLFPQGFFNSNSPMKTDAHFVVPTDGKVNNMRSNYPFGEVSNPTWTSRNGSKLGPNTFSGYSGTVFEPIDEFKGDIARMLFYFVTRYEDRLPNFNPNDSHNPLDGSTHRGYEQWYVDLLLSWHRQDPVSQREIDRNNAIYNGALHTVNGTTTDYSQHNRNPFIDHPEWVAEIWDPGSAIAEKKQDIFSVYPNPSTTHEIHIKFTQNNSKDFTIRVFDITGKEIDAQQIKSNNEVVINNLESGIYLLKISGKDAIYFNKFIIR